MRKVLGCCMSFIIFVLSFLAPPSPIFAANNQCPIFTLNGKDAISGPVQIDTNITTVNIQIGGQFISGNDYALYIDGSSPSGGSRSFTKATVDNNHLLNFSIDKTQNTINGNSIFQQIMQRIFSVNTHSVGIHIEPRGLSSAKEICSFPNAYTITRVAVNPSCDIHFGIPTNPDHPPIYQPGESINIHGTLPTYDEKRVSLQILDPTGKEILNECTDFDTTNNNFYSKLNGQTGQQGYWILNILRSNVKNIGIKTFCSASKVTVCPSLSFQVTTQTPLPTAAPGEIILNPKSPLPPCAQWAEWNGKKYVPISAEDLKSFKDKKGEVQAAYNKLKCISINTAIGEISTEPQEFVKRIFSFVLGIAGGIALILIIISGYKMMASQGNPEALTAARDQLISAIVGLLFIIFSFVILQVIGVDILKIPGFNP